MIPFSNCSCLNSSHTALPTLQCGPMELDTNGTQREDAGLRHINIRGMDAIRGTRVEHLDRT